MSKVRVYIACSLDGFIAGPDDDLSWLPGVGDDALEKIDASATGAVDYETFVDHIGAALMGRRTYDVVSSFDGPWHYGDLPVLVATHRDLEPVHPQVRAVRGDIAELVDAARQAAGSKDVYLDGGIVIRQALDSGLVDEMVVTQVPVILGEGHSLFAGVKRRHTLELMDVHRYGNQMVQLVMRPADS